MKHPKWILENDRIVIGKVEFHHELRTQKDSTIKGGGWFFFDDQEEPTFILYNKSFDFGFAKIEDVKKAVIEGNVGSMRRPTEFNNIKIRFSNSESCGDAILEAKKLN